MYKLLSCYMPYRVPGCYTKNVKAFLDGVGIKTVSLRECIRSPRVFWKCKIFNLNWFEAVNSESVIGAWIEYFYKFVFIIMLKLIGKKIIYTLHNKQPHSGSRLKINISRRITKMMLRKADAVIIMCDESYKILKQSGMKDFKKVIKILHPSFVRNYTEEYFESDHSEFVVLFFGSVQPYRNIELLIKTFSERANHNMQLLIAGNPPSEEYKNKIEKLINGKSNIKAILRFIDEKEIPGLYARSDIAILPYDYKSSLNSGAVYLSFSMSKTVICPDIGSIKELKDKSFVYTYHYESEEEHIRKLNGLLDDIQKDGKEKLKEYGRRAKEYMLVEHSDKMIQRQYAQLYFNLVKKK